MKYIDEFREPALAKRLVNEIQERATRPVRIMEFCGGHTHAIMRYGLREALAPNVVLSSGPGCPVCVTADQEIDAAIALAQQPGVTVATFGDMVKVPGTRSSLQEARARGADVRVVYSALDALSLARQEGGRRVILLGIGFETTAPTVAASVLEARAKGIGNFQVLSMHKLTPPATRGILDAGEARVDAILGPGHVTAVIGYRAWDFLALEYGIPCAVSGFEPLDMLQALHALVRAVVEGHPQVTNAYPRGVTAQGNVVAQRLMRQVFHVGTALWRGLGEIPASGLALRPAFAAHDARLCLGGEIEAGGPPTALQRGCRCGEVLRGVCEPPECPLFGRACTPARPIGPCMVSGEGACAAHFRYGRR